jgi:predicted dinucleotide-binding enzyme
VGRDHSWADIEETSMSQRNPIHRSRRTFVAAAGVLFVAAALRPAGARAQANAKKIRIGVVGSGNIGGTIGGLWVKTGHPVLFSSRHPEELKDLVAGLGELAQAGTVEQAIAFGDVVFVAVPYKALPPLGKDYGETLKDKIVLDACNSTVARDGAELTDEVNKNGIGVTSQKYLPGTRLVRAFNSMNYKIFEREANRPDPQLAIPIAGDDAEAVQVAAALVREAGFDPVVVGKLTDASRFQMGAPGFGQEVTAVELKQKLSLSR